MNGKTIKKIRKEIYTSLDNREADLVNQIFDYFDSLNFIERVKIAMKIIRRKL